MAELTQETLDKVFFWSPSTVDYEDAAYSVGIKSPEEGNKERLARNQSVVRTRAGTTLVYDRGNNYNTKLSLEFRDIPDSERAQLVVFLEAIQWATTKVCYKDMYGVVHIVRVVQDNGLEYSDMGLNVKKGRSFIRWNFALDLLDLTDNPAELETVDTVPTSALSLHIADTTDPHNPELCRLVDIADGTVVLEEELTLSWRTIIWTVFAKKDASSATYIVSGTHNRVDSDTDATAVEFVSDIFVEQGSVSSNLTIAVSLNGAGFAQTMRLTAAVATDGWVICIRRSRIGSEYGVNNV